MSPLRLCPVLLLLASCASAPPRPEELLAQGRLDEAAGAAWSAEPSTREAIARGLLARSEATVAAEIVPEAELVQALGPYLARHLLGGHVVVRLRLQTTPSHAGTVEVLEARGPRGRVPAVEWKAEELALVSGERVPSGREWSEWKTIPSPFSLSEARDPLTLSAMLVGSIIFAPLQLLSLHRETHYEPPSPEAVAAALPRATLLVRHFAPRAEGGAQLSHLLLRRPVAPDASLVLETRVRVEGAQASLTLPVAASPAAPVSVLAVASALALGGGIDARPCERDPAGRCAEEPVRPRESVAEIGLAPPPPPPTRSSPARSAAARPWWAEASYAPSPEIPKELARAKPGEHVALLSCRLAGFANDAYLVLGDREGSWRRPSKGGSVVPLLDLPPGQALSLEVWEHSFWKGAHAVARAQVAWMDGEVKGSWKPPRSSAPDCTAYAASTLETVFAERWARAIDELERRELAQVRLDVRARDLGLSAGGVASLRGHLSGLAALVGWDDPRVAALAGRVDALEARLLKGVLATVEAWERAPLAGPDGPRLELEVTGVRCDAEAARALAETRREALAPAPGAQPCLLEVQVRNPTDRPAWWSWLASDLRLVYGDGRVVNVEFLGASDQLAPGAVAPGRLGALNLPPPSATARPFRLLRFSGSHGEVLKLPAQGLPAPGG